MNDGIEEIQEDVDNGEVVMDHNYICGHCTQGTHTWCINYGKQRSNLRFGYVMCTCAHLVK